VLVKAGVVKLEPPETALRAARALLDWKLTPAAAFVVSAQRHPDEPAIVDERGRLSFAEVDRRTNALARAFVNAGIGSDDSVAIMCHDHRWFGRPRWRLFRLSSALPCSFIRRLLGTGLALTPPASREARMNNVLRF
jgi:acyl-CoA synthetase (AMP-forming)/AMP-acid ligase II